MIKLHVVKEAIQSSSSLPFITNFNLFVNAKTLTDFSPYFKDVIQYYYCQFSPVYTVCHALSCNKGGFVAQRHDGVRNLLTSLIGKVCTNVEVEPQLQPLDNERFNLRSAVTSPEAGEKVGTGVIVFLKVAQQ